jgi:succinate dehydrogenase / fumarate reductase cytochrome b subunit
MSNNARPLSPHLQVYRLPLAALLSILHRITGFGLALGAPLVVWWLFSISSGPESFAAFHDFTGSLIGQVMLFGWLYAFAYHFLNGLRHLVSDTGRWLTIKSAYVSGVAVFVLSVIITSLIWFSAGV